MLFVEIVLTQKIKSTQRGDKKNEFKWEFPGGKTKQNESFYESIKRELFEELRIEVNPVEILHKTKFNRFKLIFLKSFLLNGNIVLKEHLNHKWVNKNELSKYDLLEGDLEFINQFER